MKNVNTKLEERIVGLEKNQAKSEPYSGCNNNELSGIPNNIPEDNLKKVMIDTCHDSGLEIEPKDIKVAIVYQFLDRVGTLTKEIQ